jgi:hypothetical protein
MTPESFQPFEIFPSQPFPPFRSGFVDPGEDESASLIGDAVAAFGTGGVRILDGGGTSGD